MNQKKKNIQMRKTKQCQMLTVEKTNRIDMPLQE